MTGVRTYYDETMWGMKRTPLWPSLLGRVVVLVEVPYMDQIHILKNQLGDWSSNLLRWDDVGNEAYPFMAIAPRSSSSTCWGTIYGPNTYFKGSTGWLEFELTTMSLSSTLANTPRGLTLYKLVESFFYTFGYVNLNLYLTGFHIRVK